MGFFDFFRKKSAKTAPVSNSSDTPYKVVQITPTQEKLTDDGDLPFGWTYRNREFVERISGEYKYFLNMWLDSLNKSPYERYEALKSFVLYLEDAARICKAEGECHDLWYREFLTSPGYLEKRKNELQELESNLHEMQKDWEYRSKCIDGLEDAIIQMILGNPDILQSEFVKMFEPVLQNDVREKLYYMEKSEKIERIKSGRSYILRCKK